MIRHFKKLGQSGDTIVEVLIVLAVLGMAMSISYATANRGLRQSRNAQEHSQALGIINGQVELLRSAFAAKAGTTIEHEAGPFCLAPPTATNAANTVPIPTTGAFPFSDTLATDHLSTDEYPAACTQSNLYYVSITPKGNGVYDFRVRWDGLGDLGKQQEELTYKIGNVLVAGTFFDNDPPPVSSPLALTFTGSTTTIREGDSVRLTWSTSPVAGNCTASGNGNAWDSTWQGNKPVSGATTVSFGRDSAGNTYNYTLTCTLGTNPPVTKTVSVNVLSIYNWIVYGGAYTTCAEGEPHMNDDNNGCNPSGSDKLSGSEANSVFARRQVNITYNFPGRGVLTGSVGAGPANLTINFNQYAGENTVPPPGYSFQVTVKIFNTSGVSQDVAMVLTPSAVKGAPHTKPNDDPSWAATNATQAITLNSANISKIEVDWTNNANQAGNPGHGYSYDADLQINTIRLTNDD